MTVYVVFAVDKGSSYPVQGVYDTELKAVTALAELEKSNKYIPFDYEEFELE